MQEIDHSANPFPGLRPFESSETHLFFGRDGQSEELLRRLRRTRFLAVVGTSGSGKSSLVRAGMLPALQGGLMASAGSDWRIAILRPGGDPIGNLARALAAPEVLGARDEKGADMQAVMAETTLRRSSLGLVELVSRARAKRNDSGQPLVHDYENLLVVVDQFEELFRFKQLIEEGNSQEDAAAFVKLLLEAVGQKDEKKIYVVLTMRSDFLGDCSQFFELPEAINNGQYLIPRMTRDERREAINGPVAVGQGAISEPLVNQLLNDVGDNPDQLPILQHALMRTWDHWLTHRNGNPIDIPDYNAIGGMAEALSRHADEAYAELNDSQKLIAEKLFKGLTEKGTDNREIRRPMEVQEICELTGADEAAVIAVVEVFRREGRSFLMPPPTDALTGAPVQLNRESLIDISHESLIRNWDRLKKWTEEEAQSARIYRRLAETAMLHHTGEEALLMDPALQGALDWREKNKPNAVWARRYHPEFETAMSYLDQSVAAREAGRVELQKQRRKDVSFKRTKLAAFLLALSFLLSLAASVYAYKKSAQAQLALAEALKAKQDADADREKATAAFRDATGRSNLATRKAKDAQDALGEASEKLKDADEAKVEAIRQAQIARASETRANVAFRQAESERKLATDEATRNRELFYSADINLAQQAYETGSFERASELLSDHKPNGSNTSGFEWYYLNHLLDSERVTLKAPDEGPSAVITSYDGKTLVVAAGHKVELRNLQAEDQKPTRIEILDEEFSVGSVAISRDGEKLAVGNAQPGKETTVRLFNTGSGKEIGALKGGEGSDSGNAIVFTANGKGLVIGGNTGRVGLWDLNSSQNRELATLKGSINLAISPDGNMLAFTSSEAKVFQIVLWDVPLNREVGRLTGHDDIVTSLAFTLNGKELVSASLDKTVKRWDIQGGSQVSSASYAGRIFSMALSPDGRRIAIGQEDGSIMLCWTNALAAENCATLKGHHEAVISLAFSSESRLLFSSDAKLDKSEEGSLNFDLTAEDATIKSWDVAMLLRERTPIRSRNSRLRPVAYTADSKTLAVRDGKDNIILLDADTNAPHPYPQVGLSGNAAPVALSPNGEMLATASGGSASLWKVSTGKQIGSSMKHDNQHVVAIAFSPDSKVLTTITEGGAIRLWDTLSQEKISTLRDEINTLADPPTQKIALSHFAFSPDGKFLVLVFPKTIEFWDRTQTIPRRRFDIPVAEQDAALSLAFSPDGEILAIAYQVGNVVLHDVGTFKVLATLKSGAVRSLAFSPNGKILGTGGDDGALRLWGMATRRELLTLRGHSSPIGYITFSPDGKKIATADFRTLRVWHAPTDDVETKAPGEGH